MKDEERKKTDKVVLFDIDDAMLEDEKMDRFLKESIMQEADEIEEALNSDPDLIGYGASDDMFQAIVGKLKQQGIWEEAAESCTENNTENNIENNTESNAVLKVTDGADQTEKQSTEQLEEEPEKQPAEQPEKQLTEQLEEQLEKHLADQSLSQDQIISMLSEENQMALQQGREQQIQEQNRRHRQSRVRKALGRTAAVVIVAGCVFGVAMTSEANRRLMINAWEGLQINFNYQMAVNNLDEEASVRSKSKEEVEAISEISERLGIPVIDFGYLPEGMEYLDCDIMDDNVSATLFYSYNDKIFQVTMTNRNLEGSSYYVLDNEMDSIETFINEQEYEAEIWETNLEEDRSAYVAEIDTGEYRYILNGMVSLEEIKKILNSAYIL